MRIETGILEGAGVAAMGIRFDAQALVSNGSGFVDGAMWRPHRSQNGMPTPLRRLLFLGAAGLLHILLLLGAAAFHWFDFAEVNEAVGAIQVSILLPQNEAEPLPPPPLELPKPELLPPELPQLTFELAPTEPVATNAITTIKPVDQDLLQRYLARLAVQLDRHMRYPSELKRAGIEGLVILRLVINADGHVLSSGINRSSGFPALDEEALALLVRAQPLPALPAALHVSSQTINVPVRFKIRAGA